MTRNHHQTDPDVIKYLEGPLSNSASPHLEQIIQARVSRRDTLRGGLGLAATTLFAGAGLAGCGGDGDDDGDSTNTANLTFDSVAGSSADRVVVPNGYEVQVLYPWGTPITGSFPAFAPGTNTAEEQAQQAGMHHDGMYYFPLPSDSDASDHGLLVLNHENISRGALFFPDSRAENADGMPTVAEEVRKEINAHGVSVVEIRRDGNGAWEIVQGGMNRRITGMTRMRMSGPAAGSPQLVTPFSPDGTTTRGTFNNCGRGFTPWGTYIACEENIQGYFTTRDDNPDRNKARYGIDAEGFGFFWSNVADQGTDGEFARFDVTESGSGPTDDWRNESNNFGWLVEVDPFDPSAAPVKRTAMGRFRHEGAEPGRVRDGRPIAFYMGDDARGEYIYKFVTAEAYDASQPNPNMLDNGTLYVARFNEDGSGNWLPLDFLNNSALTNDFVDQADVLVNTRTAADILGGTPMDRPEWSTTDPNTGEIYFTLTNYDSRGTAEGPPTNAPNPRAENVYGHVIRMAEAGDNPAATTFNWDIFVFGSPADADDAYNLSGLTLANEFGGPDGLWFDPRGVLWIQTDNGNQLTSGTNDQMLAVIPAELERDSSPVVNPDNQASLKRFLVGPTGCEITGIDMTPDNRSMFVNIQHPTESFPEDGMDAPRSATIVIRRADGGEIAL